MSEEFNHELLSVEISAQSKHQRERDEWHSTPALRMYGESPGVTALQIRGRLKVPSAPPAYAHARLRDEDLLALHDAIEARLKERGVSIRALRKLVKERTDG